MHLPTLSESTASETLTLTVGDASCALTTEEALTLASELTARARVMLARENAATVAGLTKDLDRQYSARWLGCD